MANVRLRNNLIADGKFYPRGSVVDEALVPPHLHDHVDRDLQNREGKVLLLRTLNFSTVQRPDSDGVPVSFPTQVAAGQLFDLERVPESRRQSLKEGEDYCTNWTYEQQAQLLKEQEDIYAQGLVAEPVIQNR